MIGLTRLTLALLIMAAHLTQQLQMASHIAVMGFYVLGGYFATYARVNSYSGPWAFFSSRYLRLWPCYIVVFACTYALLLLAPDISPSRMGIPATGWQTVAQYFMWVPAAPQVAVVPVGWFLRWMLVGYGTIALGASRTARLCFAWLGLSFFAAQHLALTAGYATYYFSGALAMLGFAVGSSAYWLDVRLPRDGRRAAIAGALSYPLYLVHPVIEVAGLSLGAVHGWLFFVSAIPPTLALSYLLVILVERPIARYRKSLRTP